MVAETSPLPQSGIEAWDVTKMPPRDRALLLDKLLRVPVEVPCRDGHLKFLVHSRGSYKRAITLETKEPDTLRWIDRMLPGSVFWDIGANVGVYSLYAAQRGDLQVHAFEPGAVNYYILAANCELNSFDHVMKCYLLGFTDSTRLDTMEVSQFASAASFIMKRDKSKPHSTGHEQACLMFSVDDFIARFNPPIPNYIKIDVPGNKRQILQGATKLLARSELREVQVEAREYGKGLVILNFMKTFGFEIVHRNQRIDGRVAELVLGRH
jgi:FkbM family methyltransferase